MSYRFKESGGRGDLSRDADEPRSMGTNSNDGDNDKMSREDSEDRFSKFGKSLDSNRGRRPAPYGRGGRRQSPEPRSKPFGDRIRDFPFSRDEPSLSGRDRSPVRGGSFDDRFGGDRFKKDDMPFPRRGEELGRKDLPRASYFDDPYRDKFPSMEARGRFDAPGGFNSRFDLPDDPYKSRSFNYPVAAVPTFKEMGRPEGFPRPNECEIIVVTKAQRPYAENVESRLKGLGIQVDILFLKDEALLVQTIDDIARRGSLYAVVIGPQNEVHSSVTLNILYGTPQEHRNMPLDDALKLVARNFHDYLGSQRKSVDQDKAGRGPYIGAMPADKEMQFLLRVLADGRTITLSEIETVIRYLQERKDKLKGPLGDRGTGGLSGLPTDMMDPLPPKLKNEPQSSKQQDLQHRIMSLISQGGAPPSASSGGPEPSAHSGMGMGTPGDHNQAAMEPDSGPNITGRNQPGVGPNMESMGGRDSVMGPKSLAMGPKGVGMGPNAPGMGPNTPGVGPNTPGMGPGNPRIGPNNAGMGPNTPGIGPNIRGMGPNNRGMGDMGADNRGMGDMGPDNRGMGPERGMGPNERGMGPNERGMGPNDRGMGPNDRGMGPKDRDMGPNSRGIGPTNPGMGPSNSEMGPNTPVMRPNNAGMGPNQQGLRQGQPGIGYNPPSSSPSTYINFDNPSVQKALDSLMQSGPNLLKNISIPGSNSGSDQNMPADNKMKQPSLGNMNSQGGSGAMGGGGQPRGMVPGMGHQQNNMGPPSGPGMGQNMGPNMGSGPMSGMGSSPYNSGPGLYGMGPAGMMGSMPPRHMMGGPGGNPGPMMGGGRRY